VAAGSDLYLRDVNGYSASYWAKINKHVEISKFIVFNFISGIITPTSMH
jgi:hypothetical protein